MRTIKRYPNRKLYDTVRRRYVTLQSIADLVSQGENVQVIDTRSGKDVTQSTLSKIVLDKRGGEDVLSSTFLTGIIQKSRQSISGFFKRSIQAGRDVATYVEDEVERSVKRLVKMGSLKLNEADSLKKDLTRRLQKKIVASEASFEQRIGQAVERALHAFRLPTQTDLTRLRETIDDLADRIETLSKNGNGHAPATARRTKRKVAELEPKPAAARAGKRRAKKSGDAIEVKTVSRGKESPATT